MHSDDVVAVLPAFAVLATWLLDFFPSGYPQDDF